MRLALTPFLNLLLVLLWLPRAALRLVVGGRPPTLVHLVLRGPLRYRAPPRRLWQRGPRAPTLKDLRALCDGMLISPRCSGLLLELREVSATPAQWTALSECVASLQAGGKKVAVFAESYSGPAYAALCGADLLALPPSGGLELTGVGVELTSAGAALRKLGVVPRFARRETFKTAPELFTESEPSAAQRQTVDRLLDQAYEALCTGLQRRLSPERARAAIDGGPYSGRTALAAGLIDLTCFRDQLAAELRHRWLSLPPEPGDLADRLPPAESLARASRRLPLRVRPLRPPRALAVVPLSGVIRSGRSGTLPRFGEMLGSESAVAALAAARQDRRCPAALVAIESRGGSALASEIIWRELVRLAARKPTVVYVDAVAASGGYLIACGAPRLLVAPRALVGSIGVFMGHFDLSPLLQRLGVRQDFVGRGARAGLARSGPLSDGDWAALEGLADDTYQAFLQLVAAARQKTTAEVRELAQGKVYGGAEAMSLGLVDRVCGFEEALAEASQAVDLRGGQLRWFGSRGRQRWAELLQQGLRAS